MASPAKEKVLAQGSKIDPSLLKYTPGYQPSVMKGDTPPKPTTALDVAEILLGFAPTPANAVTKLAKALVPAAAVGAATYSPDSEATIVPALKKLKGMKGIHPGYDVDAFLKAEASAQGKNLSTALERKFGIFRTPEGLKTNVSDAGLDFEYGGRDIIWDTTTKDIGKYAPLSDVIRHPNKETIEEAVGSPVFDNIRLRRNAADDANGSFYPSSNTIDINSDSIARDSLSKVFGPESNILSVILHEVGHGVQKEAGHQGGSNLRRAQQSNEFVQTQSGVNKLLSKVADKDKATEQILNYIRNSDDVVKVAGKSKQEIGELTDDIISDAIYKAHAGEQSSNAAMKRFLLQNKFKHDPEIVQAFEKTPITSQMTVPVWDQIYTP